MVPGQVQSGRECRQGHVLCRRQSGRGGSWAKHVRREEERCKADNLLLKNPRKEELSRRA